MGETINQQISTQISMDKAQNLILKLIKNYKKAERKYLDSYLVERKEKNE